MRAIVDAKEFSQALNKVTKVLKQSAIPILEGVLVQIKDNICTLTATNYTTWLTTTLPAQGSNLGFVFPRPKDTAKACAYFEGELTLDTVEKSAEQDHCMKLAIYSNLLLDTCIEDSKEQGKKGLVSLSSKKKLGFLSDPGYMHTDSSRNLPMAITLGIRRVRKRIFAGELRSCGRITVCRPRPVNRPAMTIWPVDCRIER